MTDYNLNQFKYLGFNSPENNINRLKHFYEFNTNRDDGTLDASYGYGFPNPTILDPENGTVTTKAAMWGSASNPQPDISSKVKTGVFGKVYFKNTTDKIFKITKLIAQCYSENLYRSKTIYLSIGEGVTDHNPHSDGVNAGWMYSRHSYDIRKIEIPTIDDYYTNAGSNKQYFLDWVPEIGKLKNQRLFDEDGDTSSVVGYASVDPAYILNPPSNQKIFNFIKKIPPEYSEINISEVSPYSTTNPFKIDNIVPFSELYDTFGGNIFLEPGQGIMLFGRLDYAYQGHYSLETFEPTNIFRSDSLRGGLGVSLNLSYIEL